MTNRIPDIHKGPLKKLFCEGRIEYRERITGIEPVGDDSFQISFDDNKSPASINTPKIVNCTGPSTRIDDMSPLMGKLRNDGIICQYELGGIKIDSGLHVIDSNGISLPNIYALGPPTQGVFVESVSIPAIKSCTEILVGSIMQDHIIPILESRGARRTR